MVAFSVQLPVVCRDFLERPLCPGSKTGHAAVLRRSGNDEKEGRVGENDRRQTSAASGGRWLCYTSLDPFVRELENKESINLVCLGLLGPFTSGRQPRVGENIDHLYFLCFRFDRVPTTRLYM